MVLDSSAIVAWLRDEPEADAIEHLLTADSQPHVSAVTVFESRTVVWGRFGLRVLAELDQFLGRIDPLVHPFDETQSSVVGQFEFWPGIYSDSVRCFKPQMRMPIWELALPHTRRRILLTLSLTRPVNP
jgi:hypothetical protein